MRHVRFWKSSRQKAVYPTAKQFFGKIPMFSTVSTFFVPELAVWAALFCKINLSFRGLDKDTGPPECGRWTDKGKNLENSLVSQLTNESRTMNKRLSQKKAGSFLSPRLNIAKWSKLGGGVLKPRPNKSKKSWVLRPGMNQVGFQPKAFTACWNQIVFRPWLSHKIS